MKAPAREKRAGRASPEQCGFRRREPTQVAVRAIRKVFMEKGFALILKVWTDRNEVHPKQTERHGRASEEAKHSPGHA